MDKKVERLYDLAVEIQKSFRNFYLAGGTALMFKFNHRESIDLAFFSENPFSFRRLSAKLRQIFKVNKEEVLVDNVDFFIENVKVSFVFFPFKNVRPLEVFQNIKKADDYDIFLNKIYAAGRRVDPKDPFDAGFLYKKYRWSKEKIKADFEKKFPDQSYEIYLGALLNFEDYVELPEWVKIELIKLL